MENGVDRPRLIGVSHLGVSVTNLDRSLRFYCDVLGAPIVRPTYDGDRESFSGRMAAVALGPHALDLFEHVANRKEHFDPVRTGLDHIALAAESATELRAWTNWLDACEVPRSAIREVVGVGEMFDFVDPGGIQLEFLFLDLDRLSQFELSITHTK